jgi:hypothetical protein
MKKEEKEKALRVLAMISDGMENDAKEFDGKPFTGKVIAEYFGNQGAAISALANIIKSIIEKESVA